MDASIVIVSHNGRDLLRRCLASVYKHAQGIDFEVVVVDNASTDGTPGLVRSEFPDVRLAARDTNSGFAGGVNEGCGLAKGEHVLLLNPDAELSMNILPPMLAHLSEHPDVGILAPKIVDPDGSVQLSCRRFPDFTAPLFNRYSLFTRLFRGNPLSRRYLMTDFDHQHTSDVDWASAACWLVRRTTLDRVGALDEGYFWSIEDVDYCQRVHRAGLRVVYFPQVSILHHIGGSARTQPSKAIAARHRGMWRYYRAYMRPTRVALRPFVDAAVWCGIRTRWGVQLAASKVAGEPG